ncbi:MAG: VanW family protein [Bacillota bacterium]
MYYKIKRYFQWYLGKNTYADNYSNNDLKYKVFEHKTPLYRELKDVDMWLQKNKVNNLKLAVDQINGILIKPGETFSYWKTIGKPTKRKGYKKGMTLFYGKVESDIGGGLCQLSNLIYWMTLHTPLKVIERYRHSYDVFPDVNRKQPFGSGATCVYNYRDLQIKNDSNQTFQIDLKINNNYLKGRYLSDKSVSLEYEIYENNHKFTHEYWGAYLRHNTIYRRAFKDNILIKDEYITENHALMMYNPLIQYEEVTDIDDFD